MRGFPLWSVLGKPPTATTKQSCWGQPLSTAHPDSATALHCTAQQMGEALAAVTGFFLFVSHRKRRKYGLVFRAEADFMILPAVLQFYGHKVTLKMGRLSLRTKLFLFVFPNLVTIKYKLSSSFGSLKLFNRHFFHLKCTLLWIYFSQLLYYG